MNYEDEDYVRFYTRETVSWMALGWEGQTVLSLMLHGKFDRSGVFDCDGHTPSHAVTLVTRLPEDVAERGLKRLFESKTWVHRDGKIVWPKFVTAQNCRRSDKARQRESREKRRSDALGQDVTGRDTPSQPVTSGHTPSQPVTPSLAEQSRAEDPPTPFSDVTRPRRKDPLADSLNGKSARDRVDVLALFEDWKLEFGFVEAKLCVGIFNADAETLAEAIDAYGLEVCRLVLRHAKNDGMVSGRADETKQTHESIGYIFGNQNAFLRILRDAKAREQASNGGSVAELIARKKGRAAS
jgi:hypothetical protein